MWIFDSCMEYKYIRNILYAVILHTHSFVGGAILWEPIIYVFFSFFFLFYSFILSSGHYHSRWMYMCIRLPYILLWSNELWWNCVGRVGRIFFLLFFSKRWVRLFCICMCDLHINIFFLLIFRKFLI